MPKSIDPAAQAKRRKEAWRSAWMSTVSNLLMGLLLLGLKWYFAVEGFWGAVLTVVAVLELIVIVPVWILLRIRLKEIEGGEEDAAAQY